MAGTLLHPRLAGEAPFESFIGLAVMMEDLMDLEDCPGAEAPTAVGSGGIWGKGLKKGSQKLLGYLPPSVSMNDFIFAVLAEESGFMGVLLMLGLFLGILGPGLRIAIRCTDDRGRLVVIGIPTLVFCHLYVNVAMSVGLVPITGLPLPFFSAGGTSLSITMAAVGVLLSISRTCEKPL